MRLAIDHRTRYHFSEPQARLVQLLRMTPADFNDQTTVAWRIDVDCDARLRRGRDGFGNVTTMLYAEGPIGHVEVCATGEVLTTEANGVIAGGHEPLPPPLFVRSTPLTQADATVEAFAADALAGDGEALVRLHRLNAAVHGAVRMDASPPVPGRTPAEVLEQGAGPARDLAHLFLAAARSAGLPARYVSGYRLFGEGGDARPRPHAWAEGWCEGLGWVGFDPVAGLSPDERYVRIAVALDALAATPVAGIRQGEGEEVLDAEVVVERLSGEE